MADQHVTQPAERSVPVEVARLPLPTRFGLFQARAFKCGSGFVYLALVKGEIADGAAVLTRLHSECLTGDALGSLRCDCGVQLRLALRRIAAEGRGVMVYATGHEGRGIGLINKLLSYVEQDNGSDTLDANLRLGLAADARDYRDAAAVLEQLGVRCVRLLSNNPSKVEGLEDTGLRVEGLEPLQTSPHDRNLLYLRTKQERFGHVRPTGEVLNGEVLNGEVLPAADTTALLGEVRPHADRPYVALKFAQTVDGRIATGSGDARWISGEQERRISHALRAACDGVAVGVGTVSMDDPQLTVRMVPGASPLRVVFDSSLRLPGDAKILSHDAPTLIVTTARSDPSRRDELRRRGVQVQVVAGAPEGVDVAEALRVLRATGVRSLLVEGGARVITSLLSAGLVDRVVVGIAPTIIGSGTEAVGDLGISRVSDGIHLANRALHVLDDDVLLSWDVARSPE
ncbi:MAG: GTP cyclohydrolase II RibA [Euzebyales bacterium]|nr:GTP cyclohydrolase II RibA [Euzebyales bacterium]